MAAPPEEPPSAAAAAAPQAAVSPQTANATAAAAAAAAAAAVAAADLHVPTGLGTRTPDSLEDHEETHAAHLVSSGLASGPAAVRERLLQQQQQQQQQDGDASRRSLCSRCCCSMGMAAAAASRAAAGCCLTCDCGVPWMSLLQHPCSVCLSLLRLWASRYTKCLSRCPLLFLRVSFLTGCALVLLLLLAFYATFLADLPPPLPSPRFEPLFRSPSSSSSSSSSSSTSSSSNGSLSSLEREGLETADEQGLLSLLQMPLLSGAPLLQPTVSPLRVRTETLQRLFGPERHITALLIAQQQKQQRLKQEQQHSLDAASSLAAAPAGAAAAAAATGEGLLQKETLKAIWKLTKTFEAEEYRGSAWRDVCKFINTDFEMGEVCVGIGVFGVYEAALGPIETSDNFEDAFAGVSTGGVTLLHMAAAYLPTSFYSPVALRLAPPSYDSRTSSSSGSDSSSTLIDNGSSSSSSNSSSSEGGAQSVVDFRLAAADALLFAYEVDPRKASPQVRRGWERQVVSFVRSFKKMQQLRQQQQQDDSIYISDAGFALRRVATSPSPATAADAGAAIAAPAAVPAVAAAAPAGTWHDLPPSIEAFEGDAFDAKHTPSAAATTTAAAAAAAASGSEPVAVAAATAAAEGWDVWIHNETLEEDESFSLVNGEVHLLLLTVPLLLAYFWVAVQLAASTLPPLQLQEQLLLMGGALCLAAFAAAAGLLLCHVLLGVPVTPLLLLVLHLLVGLSIHQAVYTLRSLAAGVRCLDTREQQQQQQQHQQRRRPHRSGRLLRRSLQTRTRSSSSSSSTKPAEEPELLLGDSSRRSSSSGSDSSNTTSSSTSDAGWEAHETWELVDVAERQQQLVEEALAGCICSSCVTTAAGVCCLLLTGSLDLPAVSSYCCAAACCLVALLLFHACFFCPLVFVVLSPRLLPVGLYGSAVYRHPTGGPRGAAAAGAAALAAQRSVAANDPGAAAAAARQEAAAVAAAAKQQHQQKQKREQLEQMLLMARQQDAQGRRGDTTTAAAAALPLGAADGPAGLSVSSEDSRKKGQQQKQQLQQQQQQQQEAQDDEVVLWADGGVDSVSPFAASSSSSSSSSKGLRAEADRPFLLDSVPPYGAERSSRAAAAAAAAAKRQADLCAMRESALRVSQQLRRSLTEMRGSWLGRVLGHRTYRLLLLLVLCLVSLKCYGALLLLQPRFDLLRYLPPSSLLRGFIEATKQQASWGGAAPLPLHIVLPAEVSSQLNEAEMRARVNAFVDDIMALPEATGPAMSWVKDIELHANGTETTSQTLSPLSAPCPSLNASPWPWRSREAFALHLRRWRSDGQNTLCCSSSLEAGDTEAVAARKAPWLHNVTPTAYDDSFIRFSSDGRRIEASRLTVFLQIDPLNSSSSSSSSSSSNDTSSSSSSSSSSRSNREVLQQLRALEQKHFPAGGVYTHAAWMEDVHRDQWIWGAVVSQCLFVSFWVFVCLSLLLSPPGAAFVAGLLLLQVVFVGGLLSLLSVPFDAVSLIALFASSALTVEYTSLVVYVHLKTAPAFASASLPSTAALSGLMQQQRQQQQQQASTSGRGSSNEPARDRETPRHQTSDLPFPCPPLQRQIVSFASSSAPTSPRSRQQQQQQQQQQQVCMNCGETGEQCGAAGSSATAATVEVLLAASHRQRHRGALLAFLAAKETVPSILMSAVATLLGVCLLVFAKSAAFRVFCLSNLLVVTAAVLTSCCCAPLLLVYIHPILPQLKLPRITPRGLRLPGRGAPRGPLSSGGL
ncbi:hypothetical protein Emed_002439 [Eimeria media]